MQIDPLTALEDNRQSKGTCVSDAKSDQLESTIAPLNIIAVWPTCNEEHHVTCSPTATQVCGHVGGVFALQRGCDSTAAIDPRHCAAIVRNVSVRPRQSISAWVQASGDKLKRDFRL